MTALLLLAPATPMLFMGEEFGASAPFLYFADLGQDLVETVQKGRCTFLAQFRTLAEPGTQRIFPRPDDPATFERCKLNAGERETHAEIYRLHKDLLELRRRDPRLSQQIQGGLDGAVLGQSCFVLRFFARSHDDERLLVVNLGRDLHLDPAPEPLLAPPDNRHWRLLWSSEDIAYGGCGTAPPETEENWRIPGLAALAFRPESPAQA